MLNVCCGLKHVRIVSPKFDARGSALSPFSLSVAASRSAVWAARRRFPVPLCSAQPRAPRRPVGGGGGVRVEKCMWCVAHVQHLSVAGWWGWCSVILRADDGTSDVLPMCFSIPTPRPSILSWARRVGPRRRARPRARRPPYIYITHIHIYICAPAVVFSFRFPSGTSKLRLVRIAGRCHYYDATQSTHTNAGPDHS